MDLLRVGVVPDPPFSGMPGGGGLDVDLATALGEALGLPVERIEVDAFPSACDCALGQVVTVEGPVFAPPYLVSGHALAVDAARHPAVRSVDDLVGLTVAVRRGSGGQSLAEGLFAAGRIGTVRAFDHRDFGSAAGELAAHGCDAMVALGPTLEILVASAPDVDVVQRGLSREEIAIAVAPGDDALLAQLVTAQERLEADGSLQEMRLRWLGNPYRDQSLAAR
ncbi:transporter substrate-binding domain-containing protein [Mycobacterium yunnanensis]|uniref:Transporter substrate-binding domain-containing protein n=1 Tax=Mycobacterium yunnanensis TaxID=368477 RepID=A0A9X2Z3B5_9MYCO|nr:transporter substrate-binding domain-containing protein [Mycobacterium yunnanensis]MCV7422905.1 transporter substrate-binding domain-containing protein [Mycobacterium yunnanensis]